MRRLTCSASWVAFAALAQPQLASADESVAGPWQAGATSMEVTIESWGKDCGPQPQSTRSSGGGTVQLEQQGEVVTIRSANRDLRSDQCWSPNRAMKRVSTRYIAGVWTTQCKTPADDPRQESGTYSLRLLDNGRLLYRDISQFDWRLRDSTCKATITTTQTLVRHPAGTPRTGVAPAQPKREPASADCQPGPAKRLVVRPRSAEIALDQTQCFHARVLDAAGCQLEGVQPQWALEHPPAIKGELERGCFRAGKSSAEAEGTFTVIARHAGLRAEAQVQVSAASLPALLAKRMETGAVVGETAAEPEAAPARSSTRVAAKAIEVRHASDRRWLIALAALLAAAASAMFLLRARPRLRRASRAPAKSDAAQATTREANGPVTRIRRCPKCGASYPESSAFCGADGSALTSPE